jgi:PHD/YefM family antitoxin component YafN of YafNO toxin-antitoxin module
MEKITITNARSQFLKLPERTAKHEVLAVTRKNKEVLAVMSWELYEGLLETLEILSDSTLMQQLKKSLKDVDAHRTYSLKEAVERLGL